MVVNEDDNNRSSRRNGVEIDNAVPLIPTMSDKKLK